MKFFDIADYENDLKALSIIIGGRGIGKTYGALDYLIRNKKRFIYMRNTKTQIAESASEFGNPFKRLNKDRGQAYPIFNPVESSIMLKCSFSGYI